MDYFVFVLMDGECVNNETSIVMPFNPKQEYRPYVIRRLMT